MTLAPDRRSPATAVSLSDPSDPLTFLLDVAEAARTRPHAEVMLRSCLGLARLLGVRISAFVPTNRGERLRLAVTRGSGAVPVRSPSDFAAVLSEVVETGRPVSRLVPEQRSAPGAEACSGPTFAVPLGTGGVLLVDGGRTGWLTADQQRLVTEVAALLGRYLDEARAARAGARELEKAKAVRRLLEAGVRAVSRLEAAQALAATTAQVLGVSTACTYLVDGEGRVAEIATVGADPARDLALRTRLVGLPAAGSPVWRRAASGASPGAYLISDSSRPGAVRVGGVAELLGLRSLATIPLLSSAGVLGIVTCGDTSGPREWREQDRELLEQLALQGTVVVDNARLREAERHEARVDALTGLANRRAFSDELTAALTRADGTSQRVAVLQIDLDRFKEVNDSYGHADGDRLLVTVASRLREALADARLVARLGGDEFAVLLTDVTPPEAEAMAARVSRALDAPVDLGEHEVSVEASIGIALYPDHADDAEQLQQRADRAMYAAKRGGVGRLMWRREQEKGVVVDPGLLGELRRAVAEDELVLHYQPKIDLRSGRTVGVEALVRWQHPRLGLLTPDRFVPLAEQTGRIRSITGWVLPTALAQAADWRERGLDLSVAVNVSARDVADPDLPLQVAAMLDATGLPGDRLTLEVTEATVMADRLAASMVLAEIRTLGVRISLDDFGTGYTSLAYLHSLPVDEIKIDRSFLGAGERRYAVIRGILALGEGLGLRTVTEGVEDAGTASMLTALGSDQAQGYYFSRPVPAEDLERDLLGRRWNG